MKKGILATLLFLATTVENVFSQSMIISGGGDHALALCSKGQIFAWGMNDHEQLCIEGGGPAVVNKPTLVNTGNLTFSMVSAGSGSHSVALSCHKVVYAFGANTYGQCGQPANSPKYITGTPVPIPCGDAPGYTLEGEPNGEYLGGVKYITASSGASLAILDNGRCVYWGGNEVAVDGEFIKNPTNTPRYIMGPDNKPLENVIHVAGGDNNILLVVGDSPDAKVGTVYSMGNLNGRGGGSLAKVYTAAPVEIGDGTGTRSSKKYLTNVRTTGLSDAGGMAVDGITGYVYAWGKNGWWGTCGLQMQYQASEILYAEKVTSGAYEAISGEPFLTDAIQVIGGNGSAACVTKDGQILYWGSNAGASGGNSGGTIPNSDYKSVEDTKKIGPVFGNYCAEGTNPERRVEDAVAIARGDMFGFMVNSKGEFYSWGTTMLPGSSTNAGTLGTGKDKDIKTCFSKIEVSCSPQDLCPEAFMLDTVKKCPGSLQELYSGFTPLENREKVYYFQWSYNDSILNTSKATDSEALRTADKYNKDAIEVTDPGKYRVDIFYIGNNVPCDNCPEAYAICNLVDMQMPIDTIITIPTCVKEPTKPSSVDNISFNAVVNDKFYNATQKATFAAFATPTSEDTLKDNSGKPIIIETTGNGGKISFSVSGDQIDRTEGIELNNDKPSNDTLYNVWLEDISSFNTDLNALAEGKSPSSSDFNYDNCGFLFTIYSAATIESFDIFASGYSTPLTLTITPVIYKIGTMENGGSQYTPSKTIVERGDEQKFTFDGSTPTKATIKFGKKLTANPSRGTSYCLGILIKETNFNGKIYGDDISAEKSAKWSTPIKDSEGFGIEATGCVVGGSEMQNGTGSTPFFNIKFGKLTDYNCGRMKLQARLYCPCNSPKEVEIISDDIKTDVDPKYKIVDLCKESEALNLNIKPLEGVQANSKFDILWFDEYTSDESKAIEMSALGSAKELPYTINWANVAGATNITEDVENVYYVMVRDHDKPTSSACYVWDSIKVIAHPAPVDTLAWDTFCLTTPPAGDPVLTIDNKTITWTGVDPTGTIPALTATTSFPYTVTDDKTGCVSEPHTFTVTVNSTDKPKVDQAPSTTVDANGLFSLTTTISTETSAILSAPGSVYEIRWFDDTKSPTSKDVSRATAGTYTFYAQLYNTETECASEMVDITLTINDALPPRVINESLCLGDNIPDITEYVTKTLKPGETDADYELLWYSDLNDATPIAGFNTAFDATTEGEGEHTIYVSQKSTTAPFAESAKTPLTITVHNVATLDLTANRTDYCVTDVAEALTFSQNSDGDFSTAMWSTSLKSTTELNNPSATLSPNIIKGTTKYYVLPEFTNSGKEKNYASDVCYGTIQDIDINVNFTDIPNPDKPIVEVQYLKAQGDLLNRYDDLLTQDPTSVTPDANCTLKWFDASQSPLTTVPAPDYIANETGERRVIYWVSQYNTVTGCESEMKKVVAVISSIPMPTTKAITLCQGSSKLESPFKLDAQINTANGAFSESDFKLVWYKENPDKKATATAYNEIDLSQENLDYDYTTETEKDFVYYVRQVETRTGGDESPTATLVVSIYSKPILTTTQPAPICIGEFVDIKNLYEISNRIDNKTYENEYLSATGRDPVNGIAKENGVYKSRAYFTLESGETCVSDWANVTLTVNELKIEIKGDDKTCPNIGKDMEALVTSKNMLPTDNPTYTWNVSPTGEIARQKIFNMSNNGLANKGDKLTISLNVEMGACKATASHILTVEDPGVNGNISFDEEENTNSGNGKYSLSSTGIVEFDGCNRKVDVAFEVDQTEEDFTYTNLESGLALPGKFTNGKGEISVKAGLYEVSYTNTCKTSFKFDIKDKSLNIVPLWSNLVVCEGEPWNIEIKNSDLTNFVFDPNKYKKIEWKRDNEVLSQFNNKEVLNIPQTSPSDNGIYSCIVQSSGCTSKLVVGMGGSFTSKPKVTVNEALLENGGNYEAIRTKDKKITIPFLNPTGAADLAKLESNTVDGIIWKENGVQVNAGATYDIKNVVSDHEYNVVIARGQGGSNDDFCGTSVKINLKVDALLAINTSMVDEAGKEATDMCINEEGTGILIDTTGTGNVLHPENLTLKVVEKIDNQTKDIPIKAKEDKLFAEISPSKSATYDIVYKYTVGNQDSSKSAKITVHPAYEVEWDKNVRLCEGESGYIEIKKKEPANVTLTWQPDPCISKSSENGATVTAILSGDDVKEEKKLALVASNNGICADKTYYPSFIIDKSIEGEIVAPEYICEKHAATLYAKYDATDYVWSSTDQLGEGVTLKGQTVNVTPKTGYASYIVDMKRGACTLSDEVDIDVREAPKFDRIDSVTYKSIEIVLQASTGTAPFQYIVDNNPDEFVMNNVKEGLDYGEHNISVIDDAKCKIDTIVYINNPGITIPIVVSPNDDNVHDKFVVPNLKEAYPDAKIRIFDRWGKQLTEYRAGDEGMDWDGTYNGVAMPSTDYWYEIQIKEIQKTYTGHFTLIRQ